MPVIYFHDERVSGITPRNDLVILISPSHNLGQRVRELADAILKRFPSVEKPLKILHILCHGTPQGLQLGTPYATQLNVQSAFAPLRNLIGRIEIHGCSAALIYNRGTSPAGPYDGAQFCSLLAATTVATVLASDSTQYYLPSNSITNASNINRMNNWQGTVGVWNEQGRLVRVSTAAERSIGF